MSWVGPQGLAAPTPKVGTRAVWEWLGGELLELLAVLLGVLLWAGSMICYYCLLERIITLAERRCWRWAEAAGCVDGHVVLLQYTFMFGSWYVSFLDPSVRYWMLLVIVLLPEGMICFRAFCDLPRLGEKHGPHLLGNQLAVLVGVGVYLLGLWLVGLLRPLLMPWVISRLVACQMQAAAWLTAA